MTDLAAADSGTPDDARDPTDDSGAADPARSAMQSAMAPLQKRPGVRRTNDRGDRSRGWDKVVLVLFAVWIVLAAVSVGHGVRIALLIEGILDQPTQALTQALIDADTLDDTLLATRVVASLALVIALAIWSKRVRDELAAAGREIVSPADRVGVWWFVPVANLALPYVALNLLWRNSGHRSFRETSGGLWMLLPWSILVAVSGILSRGANTSSDAGTLQGAANSAWVYAVGSALAAATAVFGALYVIALTRRVRRVAAHHRAQVERDRIAAEEDRLARAADPLAITSGPAAPRQELEAPTEPDVPTWSWSSLSGAAVVAVVVGTLVGIAATPSAASNDVLVAGGDAGAVEATTVPYVDLAVGDCIPADAELGGLVLAVPVVGCDQLHRYEVFATPMLSPGRIYTEQGVADQSYERCLEEFEDRYEVDFLLSPLDVLSFYPSQESWQFGDRSATCLADTGLALRGELDAAVARGPLGPNDLMTVWALDIGDCFRGDATVGLISMVGCEGAHDWEVTAIIDMDGAPTDDEMLDEVWNRCEPLGLDLVEARDDGTVGFWDGVYTPAEWRPFFGYARIVCIVEKL